MKSIPRHENQHIAGMWWTVDHVASNQCGVGEGGGGGGIVVYIVLLLIAIFVFPVTFICIYLSSSALVFCTSCLYDFCSVCSPLHLL